MPLTRVGINTKANSMPGFSEACVSGQHAACVDPDCRCLCHAKVQELMKKATPPPRPASGKLACPRCNEIPRASDRFCRRDGSALTLGKPCACGMFGELSDAYCGFCGASFNFGVAPVEVELNAKEQYKIAEMERIARGRPSDVEAPISEVT